MPIILYKALQRHRHAGM